MNATPVFNPRVTVACIVEDAGRFLLVEELIQGRAVLNQPAGHLDPHESLIEAALRETLEETGWEVEPIGLVGVYQYDAIDRHFVRTTLAARPLRHHPARTLDHGIVRTHWLSLEQLIASPIPHRSPMVRRCVEDYLRQPLLPLSALVYRPQ